MTDQTHDDAQLDAVRSGYAFSGPALNLGAAVSGGTPVPDAQVGLPLGSDTFQ